MPPVLVAPVFAVPVFVPAAPAANQDVASAGGAQKQSGNAALAVVHGPAPTAGKQLKKKVYVNALAPEIPPAGLPQGMARDLANSFGAALVSTGDYVLGQKGLASVSVTVPAVTGLPVGSIVTCAANRVSLPTINGLYSMNSSVRSLHTVTD